jgi:hypothetical protein
MKITNQKIIPLIFSIVMIGITFLFINSEKQLESFIKSTLTSTSTNSNREYLSEVADKNKDFYDSTSTLNIDASTSNTETKLYITDPRVVAMRKFLIDYNSPIYAYADVFVYEADRTGLDWRLVASISGVESGFGNKSIVPYNGWGWKGGPNNTWSYFQNWREGITTVSIGLSYWYKGLSPYEIEMRYCPDCYEGNRHAWANGVQGYMDELAYYLQNLESM